MRPANYRPDEVRGLVEMYAVLREKKETYRSGLDILVRLADLDQAIAAMPPKEYHAVLLHGLLGHVLRDAHTLLGVAERTLLDRYHAGIEWLTNYLNGDT